MRNRISVTIRFLMAHLVVSLFSLAVISAAAIYAFSTGRLTFIKKPDYQTVSVKVQDISEVLSVSGQVNAEEIAVLRFQTSGLLSWVGVKEGDTVTKNQAVAALDRRQLQKDLEKELNDFKNERWDFDQLQDDYRHTRDALLLTDKMKRILDKAQFDLNNSVIDVELRDLSLKLATLTTPIAGIVTKVGAPYSGVNVTPAQAEFEIVNPASVYFSAEVDETDIAKISSGLDAVVTLDAYPDDRFDTNVGQISFTPLSGTTGTAYEVKLPLTGSSTFRLGLNGDADIILKTKSQVLTLPEKAITESGDKTTVQILENGQPKVVTITTGIVSPDGDVEIVAGLSADAQVVLPNGKK